MADNLLSRLGRSTGATAKTTAGASTLGQALARSAPVARPAAPIPQAAQSFAAPMREMAAAAPFIVQNLRQQEDDDPWVSVVNTDDPSDILYMPRSVAGNAPDNYVVSRQLDPAEASLRASQQETLNIYNQPEQIQAAFGIGSASGIQPPPGDLRPYDAGQANPNYRSPATRQADMGRLIDALGNPKITPAFSHTGDLDRLREQSLAGPARPDTGPDQPWWQDILDAEVPGTNRSVGDLIDFTAGTATPGYNADATGDGTDVLGPTLPGTTIPISSAAAQARDVSGSASGVWQDIYSDIINADPGAWWQTEAVPAFQSYLDTLDMIMGRNSYEGTSGKDRVLGGLGGVLGTVGSAIEAALPDTLEDIPGAFMNVLQWPQDYTTAKRTEIMMAVINGEGDSLSPEEQIYATEILGINQVMGDAKDLPFGIGWAVEQGENVLPIDYEMWILRNPDKANAAMSQGGPKAVFDAYLEDTTSDSALGGASSIVKTTQNDPLTYLPIAASAGKGLKGIGTGLRMAETAGPVRSTIGSILEGTGEGIYRGSRGAEIVADMGLEPMLDLIARTSRGLGITAPSPGSRRAAETDAVFTPVDAHMQQKKRTPDGQPIGPDPGGDVARSRTPQDPEPMRPEGPIDPGDVARNRSEEAEARGVGPDPGGDVSRTRPAQDPEPIRADDPDRVQRAQEQTEPPREGPDATDNVEYAPGVILRRTIDEETGEAGWKVDASPDGGTTRETIDSGSWENALADAEEVRQRYGIADADLNLEPARWTPNAADGRRVIDQITRDLPTNAARDALRRRMGDELNESVERQMAIKRGGDPIPDHAIETSRITYATYQAAQNQLPGGWTPDFETGRTPRAERTPYHDAEATIHTPRWENSAANRENLYRTGQIKSRLSKNPSRTQLEQARRYVDIVNEHEKWFPNDPSAGWADARANRDAILNNPRFGQYRNQLISEGNLPGTRTTARMRAQRSADDARLRQQQDNELVDPRYTLEEIQSDGTLVYRIDDEHRAYIDPVVRRGQAVEFSGHIERNGTDVTGTLENTSQAALLDELVAKAGIETAPTPDAGDVTRAADDGPTTDSTRETRDQWIRDVESRAHPGVPVNVWRDAINAPTKEAGIARFREYGQGLYGDRNAVVKMSERVNRQGALSEPSREVYERTRTGRGWERVDGMIERFSQQWDERIGATDTATPDAPLARAADDGPTPDERAREAELAADDPEGAKQFLRDLDETPDAGDAARAADTNTPDADVAPNEPVTVDPDDTPVTAGEVDPDAEPGTANIRDTLVEDPTPADVPTPIATIPPQVRQVPRIMGQEGRARPKVQRSMKIDGSTGEGWLFHRPLERQLEASLSSFRFEATGKNLYERLNEVEYELRTGKSKMWPDDAEVAAIKQVKAEFEAELTRLYPDRKAPLGLQKLLNGFDKFNQHHRERALASWFKFARYPSMQLFGNAAIATWMGRPQWIPSYLMDYAGARREIRARSRIGTVEKMETGKFKAKWNDGRFVRDEQTRVFRKEQDAWDYLAERQFQRRTKYLQKKMKIATTRMTAKEMSDPKHLGPIGQRELKRWNEHRRELIAWADATGETHLWKHDPGLSAYGKLNAAMGTRQGRSTAAAYEQFHGHADDPLMAEKFFRKMHMDTIGKYVGALSGNKVILRWGEYWDIAWRQTIGRYVQVQKLRDHVQDYRNYAIGRMQEWGLSPEDARAAWREFERTPDTGYAGAFSSQDVYNHFRKYLEEGQATRLQRDWQGRVNRIATEREAEIKRLSLASDETNLDAVLKRTLFLHYFFSRQTAMFAHQMARHPFMFNLAATTWDEMAEYIEENEGFISAWNKGWMILASLPGGRILFGNPLYLVSTWLMFNGDGERSPFEILAGVFKGDMPSLDEMDDLLGLAPVIDIVTNLFGYRPDGWTPDVLGYGLDMKNLTLLINTAKTFGWLDGPIIGNVYDDMNQELRDFLSGLGLPGSEHQEAVGSINTMEREINAIAVDEAQKQGLDPLNDPDDYDWVMQQMEDPDSDLYRAAQKRWIIGEVAETTSQVLLGPIGPRTRIAEESSDQTSGDGTQPDLIEAISNAPNGWDLLNRTDPEARELSRQRAAYKNLGTERQQVANQVYQDVRYGQLWYPVEVGGVTYSADQVNAMTPEQRKALGDALLQQYGMLDDVQDLWDLQGEFRAKEENREYAAFDSWADGARAYDGGVMAYWEEVISDPKNVDAKRYYESVMAQNLSPERQQIALTSIDAYMAARGIQIHAYYPRPDGGGVDPLGLFDGPQRPQEFDGGGSSAHKELRAEGPGFAQKMVKWNTAVQQQMTDWGYAPGTNFADLPTKDRVAIENAVKDQGIFEPNYDDMPPAVRKYIEWAAKQPAGADTSIDAYLAWDQKRYNAGAQGRFEESLVAPSDDDAMAQLPSLYYEHNHKAKKD